MTIWVLDLDLQSRVWIDTGLAKTHDVDHAALAPTKDRPSIKLPSPLFANTMTSEHCLVSC